MKNAPTPIGSVTSFAEVCTDYTDETSGQSRRLLWLQRLFDDLGADRAPALLTVHVTDGQGEWPIYSLSAYSLTVAGPRLDVCVPLAGASWSPPILFRDGGDYFAFFETDMSGSASCRFCAVIYLGDDRASQVPIEAPLVALAHLIDEGQHSEPARTWIGRDETGMGPLAFSFAIWNPGEHDNFPTGGSVAGTMCVRRDEGGRPEMLVVDAWEYSPSTADE